MKNLKGTKTEKNLMAAFSGESEARNKYTYYASKAKKDGYVQIAKILNKSKSTIQERGERYFKEILEKIKKFSDWPGFCIPFLPFNRWKGINPFYM